MENNLFLEIEINYYFIYFQLSMTKAKYIIELDLWG